MGNPDLRSPPLNLMMRVIASKAEAARRVARVLGHLLRKGHHALGAAPVRALTAFSMA